MALAPSESSFFAFSYLIALNTCVSRFHACPIFYVSVDKLTKSNIGSGGQRTVVKYWLWSKIDTLIML